MISNTAFFLERDGKLYAPRGWVAGPEHGALRFDSEGAAQDGLADLRREFPKMLRGDVTVVSRRWHMSGVPDVDADYSPFGTRG